MFKYLFIPELRNVPLDSPQRPGAVRNVILYKKPFLKKLYEDFYTTFKSIEDELSTINAPSLEIGSGGGFLKQVIPHVITSDIVAGPGIDRIENAYQLQFPDHSLKAIYMLDVLHHLGKIELFFREVERCLCPGGKLVMIEPHLSYLSKLIYKFHHEACDTNVTSWNFPDTGPLSSANMALPDIVFQRDRITFERMFRQLQISSITYHTATLYALSGGLSLKQLVPSWSYKPLTTCEKIARPLMKTWLASLQTIIISKQ